MKQLFSILFALFAVLVFISFTHAQSPLAENNQLTEEALSRNVEMNLQEMAMQANTTVVGTVMDRKSYYKGGHIYSDIAISVEEVIRGEVNGDTVVVQVLGGTVGDLEMVVFPSARFSLAERVLLLLEKEPASSKYAVVGGHQGKFTVDAKDKVQELGVSLNEAIFDILEFSE